MAPPTKLACPPAVDAAGSTRPSSPSPLTSSLSSTPVVTCFAVGSEPAAPASPVDEEDVFYDALEDLPGIDEPHSHKPVRTNVLQASLDPGFEGVAKGRMGVAPGRSARTYNTYNTTATPTYYAPPVRGSSKPAVSPPAALPSLAPLALQARQDSARLQGDGIPRMPRQGVKKALLVGINYPNMGKDRLWYAAGDAARFGQSLKALGFQHDDIRLITDEVGYEAPTLSTLLRSIDWLVGGAMAGDVLFFVFSGHCVKDQGLLTADKKFISRDVLHRHLVMRIPAGCELQIVFDCCSAAAMIQLQYCVGRMAPPSKPAEPAAACESEPGPLLAAELACPGAQPNTESSHLAPLQGSFHGIPAVASPPSPAPITPAMADLDTFSPAPSNTAHQRHRGGVVAAPPVPSTTHAVSNVTTALGAVAGHASEYVSSWFGRGQAATAPSTTPTRAATPAPTRVGTPGPARVGTPAPTWAAAGGNPRRGRQGVVEGHRDPDHFEERQGPFIQPAGQVMVWAGSGEGQQAFEAYGGIKHGIVTNAMCGALDACATANNMLTRRDFWRYLVGAIDKENTHRDERDAKKSPQDRPHPSSRVQHAELWVSQAEPSAASVLDRPMIMI